MKRIFATKWQYILAQWQRLGDIKRPMNDAPRRGNIKWDTNINDQDFRHEVASYPSPAATPWGYKMTNENTP